jgi:hypothetical protein
VFADRKTTGKRPVLSVSICVYPPAAPKSDEGGWLIKFLCALFAANNFVNNKNNFVLPQIFLRRFCSHD